MVKKHYTWHPFTFLDKRIGEITDEYFTRRYSSISSVEGDYLIDANGKKYLNTCSSLWNTNFNLDDSELVDAAIKQIRKLPYHPIFRSTHPVVDDYSRNLVKLLPNNLASVFYSLTGSGSVETAIKVVRKYFSVANPSKINLAYFKGSYHGVSYGACSVSDKQDMDDYAPFLGNTIELEYISDRSKERMILKNLLKVEQNLAAIILEPIQGEAGIRQFSSNFLKKLKDFCKKNQVFLIFDEVTTGFGRTGTPFAFEWLEVTPDIICLSKGINSGFLPLAVTVFDKKIYNKLVEEEEILLHGSTQAANPVSCAVANVVVKRFLKPDFRQRLKTNAEYFENLVREKLTLYPVSEVRGKGFMMGIELKPNGRFLETQEAYLLQKHFQKEGLFVYINNSVLFLMPRITLSKKDSKFMISKLKKNIKRYFHNE